MTKQFPYWDFQQKGMSPLLMEFLSRASIKLLNEASQRAREGEDMCRYAVILAHAACDLQTEQALDELIKWRGVEYLRKALLKTEKGNLSDDRVQRVYAALSGERPWSAGPTQAPWWNDWCESVEVRNGVAHRDRKVTREEAEKTAKVCEQYVLHLMNTNERLRKTPAS
jgi:hypothetical protein